MLLLRAGPSARHAPRPEGYLDRHETLAPASPRLKDKIVIRNARQNNLKGIDVELPRRSLVVLTGPSGSGKSSLAFDTLYAEGQRLTAPPP